MRGLLAVKKKKKRGLLATPPPPPHAPPSHQRATASSSTAPPCPPGCGVPAGDPRSTLVMPAQPRPAPPSPAARRALASTLACMLLLPSLVKEDVAHWCVPPPLHLRFLRFRCRTSHRTFRRTRRRLFAASRNGNGEFSCFAAENKWIPSVVLYNSVAFVFSYIWYLCLQKFLSTLKF